MRRCNFHYSFTGNKMPASGISRYFPACSISHLLSDLSSFHSALTNKTGNSHSQRIRESSQHTKCSMLTWTKFGNREIWLASSDNPSPSSVHVSAHAGMSTRIVNEFGGVDSRRGSDLRRDVWKVRARTGRSEDESDAV